MQSGELDRCEQHRDYQSPPRTVVETILCILVVASYVPQYLSISRHGTRAISSRFVLFHCLFSTLTFALRLQHPQFYNAFNCVYNGAYPGWKAYSSVLGFIQADAQFFAAMVLLALYLKYRTQPTPDDPVEYPEPGVTSTLLKAVVGTVAVVVVRISLAFLLYNESPLFDKDDPESWDRYIAAYVIGLSVWDCLLIPANITFVILQFVWEIRTVRELRTRGALNLVALSMQSVAFILLAIAQTLRSWAGIQWGVGPWSSFGRFVEELLAFYGTVNTHVAYFLTGIGFLALLFVALLEGEGDVGRIRL